jgi:Leu/Phe-tRNA-protein transferase
MPLLDGQVESEHLARLGFHSVPRERFLAELAELSSAPSRVGNWGAAFGTVSACELAD